MLFFLELNLLLIDNFVLRDIKAEVLDADVVFQVDLAEGVLRLANTLCREYVVKLAACATCTAITSLRFQVKVAVFL